MSEDLTIPVTTEESNMDYLQAGVHLVKISDIQKGKPDSKGFPCHEYTFQTQEGKSMKKNFYFTLSPNDPNKKCKAEFIYTKLKAAIGLKSTETKKRSELINSKLWIVVKRVDYVDADGKHIKSDDGTYNKGFFEIIPVFFPYTGTKEDRKKPALEGDPDLNGGKPSGQFYDTKLYKAKESSAAATDDFADDNKQPAQPEKKENVAEAAQDW